MTNRSTCSQRRSALLEGITRARATLAMTRTNRRHRTLPPFTPTAAIAHQPPPSHTAAFWDHLPLQPAPAATAIAHSSGQQPPPSPIALPHRSVQLSPSPMDQVWTGPGPGLDRSVKPPPSHIATSACCGRTEPPLPPPHVANGRRSRAVGQWPRGRGDGRGAACGLISACGLLSGHMQRVACSL